MSEEKIEVPEGYRRCEPREGATLRISKESFGDYYCGEVKLESEFNNHTRKNGKVEIRSSCKECTRSMDRKRRQFYKERNSKIREDGNWEEHLKEQFPSGKIRCSHSLCKEEKDVSHFCADIMSATGMSSFCISCRAYFKARYRHKNKYPDQEMISFEEYIKVFFGECHEGKYRPHLAYGVDRIDSNKGYVKGNVVSMCIEHNKMKLAHSHEKCVELAMDIVESARMREEEKPKVMTQGMLF